MANVTFPITLNMVNSGSKVIDIPNGYSFMTFLNNTNNVVSIYQGSDANGKLLFTFPASLGLTLPILEGREFWFVWTNGDSSTAPKPAQILFSVANLNVSTNFGNNVGQTQTVGTNGYTLNPNNDGSINVDVLNFPATQITEEAGWTWKKVTAAGAGDVSVKGTAGKVAKLVPDASEVIYLKDGTNQSWKTGPIDTYGLPISCLTSILVNFAGAGNAWILYK